MIITPQLTENSASLHLIKQLNEEEIVWVDCVKLEKGELSPYQPSEP